MASTTISKDVIVIENLFLTIALLRKIVAFNTILSVEMIHKIQLVASILCLTKSGQNKLDTIARKFIDSSSNHKQIHELIQTTVKLIDVTFDSVSPTTLSNK